MLNIESRFLLVEILDPVLDRDKMGTRFCSGGQIFQVYDKANGPLLSGPTYPASYNSFDSQGLPDGFTVYPGFENCTIGDPVMVIGVGMARYSHAVADIFPRVNREMIEWLDWQVQKQAAGVTFKASHRFRDYAYTMTRKVMVDKRSITVATVVENRSGMMLPLSWFAHPFYPFPAQGIAGNIPSDYQPNHAYGRRADGQMVLLHTPANGPVDPGRTFIEGGATPSGDGPTVIEIKHGRVGTARVECRFPVASLPCWYNENTFSPEPYLVVDLPAAKTCQWEIVYRF